MLLIALNYGHQTFGGQWVLTSITVFKKFVVNQVQSNEPYNLKLHLRLIQP